MQQGDCNAPAIMMRVMQHLLRGKLHRGVVVYLDDIIIGLKTYEEHVELVRYVLDILKKKRFYLNKEKCHFLANKIEVLKYIVTPAGLSADPIKIGKVMDFHIPNNRKMLQAFVGIVNYLGKFCSNLFFFFFYIIYAFPPIRYDALPISLRPTSPN